MMIMMIMRGIITKDPSVYRRDPQAMHISFTRGAPIIQLQSRYNKLGIDIVGTLMMPEHKRK